MALTGRGAAITAWDTRGAVLCWVGFLLSVAMGLAYRAFSAQTIPSGAGKK